MKRNLLALPVLVWMTLMLSMWGCTCARDAVRTTAAEEHPAAVSGKKCPAPEEKAPPTREHVVKRGECLWWIAEYEDIYNDPFLWPLLYTANRDRIRNPDRIYPDQVLRIPRSGHTMDDVREARRRAGASPPYTPPGDSLPPLD